MGLDEHPPGRLPRRLNSAQTYAPGPSAFFIRVEQQDADLILRLGGDFDWACVARVEAALDRIRPTTKHVVFDLQDLTFLDSRGLKTILRANERARGEPFDIVVVRPRGLANRVFTLTRAGDKLKVLDRPPATAAA